MTAVLQTFHRLQLLKLSLWRYLCNAEGTALPLSRSALQLRKAALDSLPHTRKIFPGVRALLMEWHMLRCLGTPVGTPLRKISKTSPLPVRHHSSPQALKTVGHVLVRRRLHAKFRVSDRRFPALRKPMSLVSSHILLLV